MFGDSIDYRSVKIARHRYAPFLLPLQDDEHIMSPDGNIYFPEKNSTYRDDFSVAATDMDKAAQDTFIHEMTHVWQVQHGIDVAGPWIGQVIGHSPSYTYTLGPGTKFTDYGIEQQATIVQDYFALWKYSLVPKNVDKDNPVPTVDDYRRILPFK